MNTNTSNLFDYALGHNGYAGIAIISNELRGFDLLTESLTALEIQETIEAYLDNEVSDDKDDEARLAALLLECKDQSIIEEITERHTELFNDYKNNQ